jgi:hypothetical protein
MLVTTRSVESYHALLGSAARVSSIFQPCWLAVARSDRITAKSAAPATDRTPKIFWRSYIMGRPAGYVVGERHVRSERKRSTSPLRMLRRNSRLWPTRRGLRPRALRLPLGCARASAVCAAWSAAPLGHDGVVAPLDVCSGFAHVTARRIARPTKAALITRLRSGRLPNRTARQLPLPRREERRGERGRAFPAK